MHISNDSHLPPSLESKFHAIRLVSKFVGFYTQVDHLNVSGTNMEDMLEKARELWTLIVRPQNNF